MKRLLSEKHKDPPAFGGGISLRKNLIFPAEDGVSVLLRGMLG